MTTEARLRYQARASNGLISWYSFCAILISLLELAQKFEIPYANIVLTALSVGIFAVSLYIAGERYSERAEQFRNCYLALQRIYNSDAPVQEKMREYASTLEQYENQSDDDYDEMIFDAVLRGQRLENSSGEIVLTRSMAIKVLYVKIRRVAVLGVLFLAPVFYMVTQIRPK